MYCRFGRVLRLTFASIPFLQFTGLTKEEFKHLVIGGGKDKSMPTLAAQKADLTAHVPVEALPASLDWREKGVVTKVKDQGGCGGCWSFSAAETLESHIAIKTGKLFVFSEQEILACTPNPNQCGGTGGCNGATQELAFEYVGQAGITTETQWPYEMRSGTCDWTGKTPVANITGCKYYILCRAQLRTTTLRTHSCPGVAHPQHAPTWPSSPPPFHPCRRDPALQQLHRSDERCRVCRPYRYLWCC